jgi:hypothetical protein
VDRFLRHKGLMVDINIEMDAFASEALRNNGYFIQSGSASVLPQIVEILKS